MRDLPTYRWLNLERHWPLFARTGVEVGPAGELTLASVPTLGDTLGDPLPPAPGLEGPAGIGVDPCGDLYVADPAGHRILRVDGCDGCMRPLPCLAGPGPEPGQLDTPRGVAVGRRGELYVADAGNHRVQVFDLATGRLRAVWGQPTAWGEPTPSDAPGRFHEPWDVAVDAAGSVYVADPGERQPDGSWRGGRVQKFRRTGAVDPAFTGTIDGQPTRPGAPASVAVALLAPGDPDGERLLVLDRQPPRLLVYHLDGRSDDDATRRWAGVAGAASTPVSVAVGGGALYVADATAGRVLVFDLDGHLLGVARAGEDTVAGIALDCRGRLVAHPGGGAAVRRAAGLPSYVECGTFLAGPFEAASEPTRWQRLAVDADELAPGAHVRFFTLTSDTLDGKAGNVPAPPSPCGSPPAADVVPPDALAPAARGRWRAAPWDATDLLALNEPATYLWIAGVLDGDGTVTPTLRQIRLQHDEEGWLRYLPAIYSRDATSRVFLERALALFEGLLDEQDTLIDDLPLLFDPWAAPDTAPRPAWLDWLAGWVDASIGEAWEGAVRRRVVADAFQAHATRGSKASLRALVALHTGATARITELAPATGPWALGGEFGLGFDTALAPAAPDGAVLGSTAVVERSRLTPPEDFGVPAFADVAHRFAVHVYAAQLSSPDTLEQVRRVLDREKPAHTTYELCVIEPRMRVGAQAVLGVDSIVGGPPPARPLDQSRGLGMDSVLPAPRTGRRLGDVVDHARVGARATVG